MGRIFVKGNSFYFDSSLEEWMRASVTNQAIFQAFVQRILYAGYFYPVTF
jgi:hypothetical protein